MDSDPRDSAESEPAAVLRWAFYGSERADAAHRSIVKAIENEREWAGKIAQLAPDSLLPAQLLICVGGDAQRRDFKDALARGVFRLFVWTQKPTIELPQLPRNSFHECVQSNVIDAMKALFCQRYYERVLVQSALDTRDWCYARKIYGPVELAKRLLSSMDDDYVGSVDSLELRPIEPARLHLVRDEEFVPIRASANARAGAKQDATISVGPAPLANRVNVLVYTDRGGHVPGCQREIRIVAGKSPSEEPEDADDPSHASVYTLGRPADIAWDAAIRTGFDYLNRNVVRARHAPEPQRIESLAISTSLSLRGLGGRAAKAFAEAFNDAQSR